MIADRLCKQYMKFSVYIYGSYIIYYLVESHIKHPDKGRERRSNGGVIDDRGGRLDLNRLLVFFIVTEAVICNHKHPKKENVL